MATPAVSSARQGRAVPSIRSGTASRWIAFAVAVVAALLAAWGWSQWTGRSAVSSQPVAVSGSVGVVGGPALSTSGPAIPVDHPEPQPFQRILVTGTTTAGSTIRRSVRADRQGHFSLRLPTGTYKVTSIFIRNAPMEFQPFQKITVRSGHPAHVRLIDPAS